MNFCKQQSSKVATGILILFYPQGRHREHSNPDHIHPLQLPKISCYSIIRSIAGVFPSTNITFSATRSTDYLPNRGLYHQQKCKSQQNPPLRCMFNFTLQLQSVIQIILRASLLVTCYLNKKICQQHLHL